MQRDDALELVGALRAPFRLAFGEGLLLAVVGRRQMIDAGQQRTEQLAVADNAADRDAAKADAVIAALAPDQAGARSFAADGVIGERDLERGVHRFGAGVAEEHMIEVAGRERGDPARQLESLRVGKLEARRIVELGGLPLDRLHDGVAVVAGIDAPEPGGAIEHRAAVGREIVHVLGPRDQPRRRLEGAVRREREPERFEIVRHGAARWCRSHGHSLAALECGCYQPRDCR